MSLKDYHTPKIARQGAVSLSEAGYQVCKHHLKSPGCGRFAPLACVMKSVPLRGTNQLEKLKNH